MVKEIAVVAEDLLTQAVLHKCISEVLPAYTVARTVVKGGRGNVQRELGAYAAWTWIATTVRRRFSVVGDDFPRRQNSS
jgi:hypothetical protein